MEEKTNGMIDISNKEIIKRTAIAYGKIYLNERSIQAIRDNSNPKGDVLENAKLSAIHAVKKTPELVFMAHPISINSVKVEFEVKNDFIECYVSVNAIEKTGVEVEAVAGVMNALLAIFDLSKRYEKDEAGQYKVARVTEIKVIKKTKEQVNDGLETT